MIWYCKRNSHHSPQKTIPTKTKKPTKNNSTEWQASKRCKLSTFFFIITYFYAGTWETNKKYQVLNQKNSQRVRFSIENFTTCQIILWKFFLLVRLLFRRFSSTQILNEFFFKISDFEGLKINVQCKKDWRNQILKKRWIWKIKFWHISFRKKNKNKTILVFFKKHGFQARFYWKTRFWVELFLNKSDYEIQKSTTCHILYRKTFV